MNDSCHEQSTIYLLLTEIEFVKQKKELQEMPEDLMREAHNDIRREERK